MGDQAGCECSICDEDFESDREQKLNQSSSLRDRIAAAIQSALNGRAFGPIHCGDYLAGVVADAVITEMDLATPCDRDGCRMRQITRRSVTNRGEQ